VSRIVYVNGAYLPEEEARISVFDRGFLFADAVYEVTSVLGGRLVDFAGHLARLHRSLAELEMAPPLDDAGIEAVHRELLARNGVEEGMIYLQVTRGAADRDFAWPKEAGPSFVAFTQARPLVETASGRDGIRVISVPDIRWARRDIKTVQLLAPSWCKMMAKKAGKDDAWLVEDGLVTEGSSTNAWIVDEHGQLRTRDTQSNILHGITRAAVLRLAAEAQLRVEERPFSVAEAQAAAEAFMTAASAFVTPVVEIDGRPIGEGGPGPVTRRLRELYIAEARARAV
jgi:D-alanine transaminase